jgi:RNA-directed DNA polymerase
MRELYIEGVAIRGGPESCAAVREGVGEALTGVRAGWAIEPRKHSNQGADAVDKRGRRDRWSRYREWLPGPAWSKNLCMHGISMREMGVATCSGPTVDA